MGSAYDRRASRRLWSGLFLPALAVAAAFQIGNVSEVLEAADGWWGYALVFILAAIPWWEVLLVVPPAIGIGLDPISVAILAFLGNVLPIYLILAAHRRATAWIQRRREREDSKSKRSERARRLFERYGLPGVALAAPIATGVHLATVIVLLLDAPPRSVAVWMTGSVALWTVALTASSVAGFGLLGVA